MIKCIFLKKIKPFIFTIIVFIFLFLSLPVFGDITIDPNGLLTPGTILTVQIKLEQGKKSIDLEIVKDENGNGRAESNEKRLLNKTPVNDGDKKGKLKDHCDNSGIIEIHCEISTLFKPGKYIVRAIPGQGGLPEGAVLEIVSKSGGGWIKIDDPAPILQKVRDIMKQDQIKNTNLWLMNAGTYEITGRLTDTGDCLNPCWSPDGKQIAYVRWINGKGQLWTITMENGKAVSTPVKITSISPESISNPAWSPSSENIAFLSRNTLWLAKADFSKLKKIASPAKIRKILAWTRDGKSIIFSAYPAEDTPILGHDGNLLLHGDQSIIPEDKRIVEIWKVGIHTGKQERLAYDVSWQWLPYVSPDGTKLVFPIKDEHQLWLRQGKGFNDVKPLTEGNHMDFDPAWSPDGRWIVFVSDRNK